MRAAPRISLLLLLSSALCAGCFTRTIREDVFDDGLLLVELRGQARGAQTIDRGFDHPAEIAQVRLAHILSRIDMRKTGEEKSERIPAIPLETLYSIADGIKQGLAKADSSQEVVIQSIRRDRHLAIFDRRYLTSLLCYVKDDLLYIHISRSDWEIPRQRKTRLPQTHVGEYPLAFRLVIEEGMVLADHQSVAVEWRHPVFKRPTRTRITPGGRVVRRTILMESFDDEELPPEPVPADLSPDQLRALADLEEQRRAGALTEAEYRAARRRILGGETP